MTAILSRQNFDSAKLLDKIQILIVNQSEEVSTLLKNILSAMGFRQSFTASDAVEAVRYMKEMRIHIIIADSELRVTHPSFVPPGQKLQTLSGAEFVRSLRFSKTSPNPYVAAVIVAREMDENETIRARDCGVNGVVLKPLEAAQLCFSLKEIVDIPRKFVVAENFKGPCRRKEKAGYAGQERRRRDIHLVRNNR